MRLLKRNLMMLPLIVFLRPYIDIRSCRKLRIVQLFLFIHVEKFEKREEENPDNFESRFNRIEAKEGRKRKRERGKRQSEHHVESHRYRLSELDSYTSRSPAIKDFDVKHSRVICHCRLPRASFENVNCERRH